MSTTTIYQRVPHGHHRTGHSASLPTPRGGLLNNKRLLGPVLTVVASFILLAVFVASPPAQEQIPVTVPVEQQTSEMIHLPVEEVPLSNLALMQVYIHSEDPLADPNKPTSSEITKQGVEEYPVYETQDQDQALAATQNSVEPNSVAKESPQDIAQDLTSESKEMDRDDEILEDAQAFRAAPIIQALPEATNVQYRLITLQHERYYRTHPSRLYVPRLRKTARLTVEEFAERFIRKSQPVIIPFEAMRHLGFNTRSYSLDELLKLYPGYERKLTYRYGSPGAGEMDLGPAVWALKQGKDLVKTASGRNFPRNTKVSLDKLRRLDVSSPPYILPNTNLLAPSLWFAATTSSTATHSDCCDNYAMMISGTKRWTIAPPNEARILHPSCTGGLCWVKKLEHADEHASSPKEIDLRDKLQKVTFDLGPNEMLFLPTGWFHHVENSSPTIMINFWTKGGPGFLRFLDGTALSTPFDKEKSQNAKESRRALRDGEEDDD